MVGVCAWGRLERPEHLIHVLSDRHRVADVLRGTRPGLAHGMGRSYGDVCVNPGGALWLTRGLDRFIEFDADSGSLVCEAGVLLRDIQRLAIPRGWMLPVTPGTQLATVGGAIANDVHGKNHHGAGTFGDHVRHIELLRSDGSRIACGPEQNPDWFRATIGGLGLTGVISVAELRLRRTAGPWLLAETLPFRGLEEFFHLADASAPDWEHTVAWIDCRAPDARRGLFLRARAAETGPRAEPRSRALAMPFTPPVSLVNRLTLGPFNRVYHRLGKRRTGARLVHYRPFFYPLDHVRDWNRMYGPRGFFQYQSVIPPQAGHEATRAMLDAIAHSREGSCLAVLKTFGERAAPGLLSFPRPGVTLALDFPNRGADTLRLFERLDAIVAAAGGRLYPAKDARMPRHLFEAGYPRLGEFLPYRDPGIGSALSRRLLGS